MKRLIYTLLVALTATLALAQQNTVTLTTDNGDTTVSIKGGMDIYFGSGNKVSASGKNYYQEYDNTLRGIDFRITNPIQNSTAALKAFPTVSSSFAYDWGYGSTMRVRDVMTEDFLYPSKGYNWYSNWSSGNYLGKVYACTYFTWEYYYKTIFQINAQIAELGAEDCPASYRPLLGALYAMRAHHYLDLARLYECLPNEGVGTTNEVGHNVYGLTVPIAPETQKSIHEFVTAPRALKADMVAYIQQDLDRAESLLAGYQPVDKTIPDEAVVHGLRARLALWTENYPLAAAEARKVIDMGVHTPVTQAEWLSKTEGFNTLAASSWIWGVQVEADDDILETGILNWTSWSSNEASWGYAAAGVTAMIGSRLYNAMSDKDFRKLSYKAPQGSALSGKEPLLRAYDALALDDYGSIKFRPAQGNTEDYQIGGQTAFPLMRIEEMYLIEAEAKAQQGELAAAKALLQDFVNSYRDNTYTSSATTAEELVEDILTQKRIELWGEGLSFFDIKRLNHGVNRTQNSNNPLEERFITRGRPAWMNLVIPVIAEENNPALLGWNNPDPSGLYTSYIDVRDDLKPGNLDNQTEVDTTTQTIVPTHQLDVPASALAVLPVDSIISVKYSIVSDNDAGSVSQYVVASLCEDMSDAVKVGNDGKISASNLLKVLYSKQESHPHRPIYVQSYQTTTNYLGETLYSKSNVVKLNTQADAGRSNLATGFFGTHTLPDVCLDPMDESAFSAVLDLHSSVGGYGNAIVESNKINFVVAEGYQNNLNVLTYLTAHTPEEVRNGLVVRYRHEVENDMLTYAEGDPFRLTLKYADKMFQGPDLCFAEVGEITVPEASNIVTLSLRRMTLDEAAYQLTCDRSDVEIPEVKFSEYQDYQHIDINLAEMKRSGGGQLTVTIPQDLLLPGTPASVTINVNVPTSEYTPWYKTKSQWVSDGNAPDEWPLSETGSTCSYTYTQIFSGEDPGLPISYRQGYSDKTKGQIRIDNWAYGVSLILDYNTQTGNIQIEPQYTGYTDGGVGDFYITDITHWQNKDYYESFPCHYDRITGHMVLNTAWMAGDNHASCYGYGEEYVQVDGFPDYSVSMGIASVQEGEDGTTYATASLTLGSDVKNVRALVICQSDDAQAKAEALVSGQLAGTTVEAGNIMVPFDLDALGSNQLTLLVAFVGAGGATAYATSTFSYYRDKDTWVSLGMGLYNEGIVSDMYGVEPSYYEVEIKESLEHPGLYRIMNPYGKNWSLSEYNALTPCEYLEVNACDPQGVYILPQMLGVGLYLESGVDPELGFASYAGYFLSSGKYTIDELKGYGVTGIVKDGRIQFPTFASGEDETADDYYTYQGIVYYGKDAYYGGNGVEILLPSAVGSVKENVRRAPARLTAPSKPVLRARGEKKSLIVAPVLKQKQLPGVVARPLGAPALQVNPDAAKYE